MLRKVGLSQKSYWEVVRFNNILLYLRSYFSLKLLVFPANTPVLQLCNSEQLIVRLMYFTPCLAGENFLVFLPVIWSSS